MSGEHGRWRGRAGLALYEWRADLSDGWRAGDLAALRRLSQPRDAMLVASFAELCNRALGRDDDEPAHIAVLARCAFLAARLSRFEEGALLAAAMAEPQRGGRPLISPVRASVLFSLESADQACAAIASLLGSLGGPSAARLDAPEMVWAMSDWDGARRDMALRYHRVSAPQGAPAGSGTPAAQPGSAREQPSSDPGSPA